MPPKRLRPTFAVTADVVMLSVRDGELCVLVVKRGQAPHAGRLALPGGFVEPDEDVARAAARELLEETGLKPGAAGALEQVGAYGAPARDPRGRVLSVAHVAALPPTAEPVAGDDAAAARWEPVAALTRRRLAFDHHAILTDALEQVARRLATTSLATTFLGRDFTISELRAVYEAVWGVALDPGNFQRKILGEDLVVDTGRQRLSAGGRGRPASVYRARGRALRTFSVPIARP